MTSPFNAEGDADIREYITSNWTQLSLVRDGGTIEAVIDIPSDSRASWSAASSNPIEVTMTVSAGDADISAPLSLQGTAIHDAGEAVSAGDALGNTTPYHDDAFQAGDLVIASGQTIDIVHQLQQPTL